MRTIGYRVETVLITIVEHTKPAIEETYYRGNLSTFERSLDYINQCKTPVSLPMHDLTMS